MSIQWVTVDSSTSPGVEATVNGHSVFVSTFDEAPLRASHAYYWQIDGKRGVHWDVDGDTWFDGWAGTTAQAKRDAAAAAMQMNRGPA